MENVGYNIDLTYDYYQDDYIIVEWLGIIPNPPVLDGNGNIVGETTYRDDVYVNVRSINDIDITLFQNTTSVHPEIPYRVFS